MLVQNSPVTRQPVLTTTCFWRKVRRSTTPKISFLLKRTRLLSVVRTFLVGPRCRSRPAGSSYLFFKAHVRGPGYRKYWHLLALHFGAPRYIMFVSPEDGRFQLTNEAHEKGSNLALD